ncbi:related to peptide-n4- (n-acetyl- beta -glucosaminyl) asparagine amidase [Ustilago trichophora]|uniref:Related to peptide-n4- (N-acetyl- beta -glucosaminyl) asparagine amidase n=1 Tax=Ustilago trichophora TaxID=86804 RepID=A0A5C3EQU2_9BASI|nr:related to peptide-n4- (n-acetyl- beta -glucosaminyl) asparagine amidase [Ustilago trichophora]
MHLIRYALLATTAAAVSSGTLVANNKGWSNNVHWEGVKQLKIPAIWKSPLFKAAPPGIGPPSSPPHPSAPHSSPHSSHHTPSSLQENFQISAPAPILTNPLHSCTTTLLTRSFGNSYNSPSSSTFDPSASFSGTPCSDPSTWTSVTLDLHGETRGRQFDRLGTVWVGNNVTGQGVEILRFDNPEPTRTGVYWDTKKDVGKYWKVLSGKADVVVDLPNIVDATYTGALNVTLALTVGVDGLLAKRGLGRRHAGKAKAVSAGEHPSGAAAEGVQARQAGRIMSHTPALPLKQRAADLVIPLSKRLQTSNSIFLLGGSAGNGTTSVTIPQNTARAIVEIYASGTATEEFWYTGLPDSFYSQIPDAASNGYYGHGPYREVQLYIDGQFAGFVTPYPVIFTGGINPLLWRPSANYGTFDQPTYNIDITPWVGGLTDGKEHSFELAVVSSEVGGRINDASWFVSGNVQVYLDASEKRTVGSVVKVEKGGEFVDGYTRGKMEGDPLVNGTLSYEVGLKQPRSFGVAGTIKTGSGVEYVAGWYQTAQFTNRGFVNATTQTNDQKSYGSTRSLVLNHSSSLDDHFSNFSFEDLSSEKAGVQVVQQDYNFPLYVTSSLSKTSFDASVSQQFDRTVRRSPPSPSSSSSDLTLMLGDETTFTHSTPIAAHPHTLLSTRKQSATSILQNGAIANGSATSQQSFMYRDMSGGTIDRFTTTNSSGVLVDRLAGSLKGRAQPGQLEVV